MSQTNYNQLGEVVESLSVENLNTLLGSLEQLLKDSVVDINNDYEKVHASVFVIGAMIDKKISHDKIHLCTSLIHGECKYKIYSLGDVQK